MKIKAYAKINLTLDICGKRADGYHLLDSVMQSISLYDLITLEKSDKISVTSSISSLSGEENIAYKAAKQFFDAVKINSGAEIFIKKNIPYPAGLGGGSADAAAVICGLNKLYNTSLSNDELCEIGLKVGADVPFCIVGGTARVEGIGEIITPLKPIPKMYFLLAKNGEKASTKEMYYMLDNAKITPEYKTAFAVDAICNSDINGIFQNISNSFASVCGLYNIDELLKGTSPLCVSLSGSGPTVFAVYSDKQSTDNAKKLLECKGIECFIANSVDFAMLFE